MIVVGVVVVVALVEMAVIVLVATGNPPKPPRQRTRRVRNKTPVGLQGPKKTPSQGFQGLKKNLSQSGHENSPFGGQKKIGPKFMTPLELEHLAFEELLKDALLAHPGLSCYPPAHPPAPPVCRPLSRLRPPTPSDLEYIILKP